MADEDVRAAVEHARESSAARPRGGAVTVTLEVEEALGPGLDIIVEHGVARARGPRRGTLWLGLDRAHVAETDAGDGTHLAAVVALPASSFSGCRIVAELLGALTDGGRRVLVARLRGSPVPPEPLVRTVAQVRQDAGWIDAAGAMRQVREAHARYRARRAESRIVDGRAWQPGEGLDPGTRRFTTPHSRAEYRLDRLPPRFLRGLEGLLDDDERILYAIERPPAEASLLERVRGARDARAALLVLTDRQLLWLVDHMPPNRYLLDWGVDARLVALEALRDVAVAPDARRCVEVRAVTSGGSSHFTLPPELRSEALVMVDLLRRFTGSAGTRLPRRRYAVEPLAFDPEGASRFGQAQAACAMVAGLEAELRPEPVLGRFYAPHREHQPEAVAFAFSATRLLLSRAPRRTSGPTGGPAETRTAEVALAALRGISLSLSPLVCRIELEAQGARRQPGERLSLSYPSPLAGQATPVLRLLRRTWANATPPGTEALVFGTADGAVATLSRADRMCA